jgi:hypothetical protein
MKTKQAMVVAGLAVVVGGAIVWALISKHQIVPTTSGGEMLPATAVREVSNPPKISAPETNEISAVEPLPPAKSVAKSNDVKLADAAPAEPPMVINGYELQDPMARVALNFVGSDPDADSYWIGAINDSSLPAEERKDLIEDLNEDGLSNPRHPAARDLPLILRRIRRIEQLVPLAMDDVNRDAFAEAYKDLTGLLNGQPPQ